MSADTDMVEKVARAIAHARSWQTTALTVGDWDDRSKGERQPFLEMARAALDASGIGELVEALEPFASVSFKGTVWADSDDASAVFFNCETGHSIKLRDFYKARAALSRARATQSGEG